MFIRKIKNFDKNKADKEKLQQQIIHLQEELKNKKQIIIPLKKIDVKLNEGERYYTPNTDMPLWRIADNFGNQENWYKIFDHPENKGKISLRDKNTMIKKDTLLVIPDLEGEEEEE